MNDPNVAILGFGNVGRAFAGYTARIDRAGCHPRICAVADRSGGIWLSDPAELNLLVEHKASGRCVREFPGFSPAISDSQAFIDSLVARGIHVLVESLPSNLRDGQPALGLITRALAAGLHVVTVDKGPLARGFDMLKAAAQTGGARLGFTGTTGVAIPGELDGERVLEIRGVLNGTTNYILSEMQDRDISFDAALAAAQASGIAEPDPSLDIDGWDTAVKTLILANALMAPGTMGGLAQLDDVTRLGIGSAIEELIRTGRRMNRIVRLVGRARFHQGRLRVSVAPKLVSPDSPFYALSGTSKLAVFRTASKREVIARAPSSRDAISQTIVDDILRVIDQAAADS